MKLNETVKSNGGNSKPIIAEIEPDIPPLNATRLKKFLTLAASSRNHSGYRDMKMFKQIKCRSSRREPNEKPTEYFEFINQRKANNRRNISNKGSWPARRSYTPDQLNDHGVGLNWRYNPDETWFTKHQQSTREADSSVSPLDTRSLLLIWSKVR